MVCLSSNLCTVIRDTRAGKDGSSNDLRVGQTPLNLIYYKVLVCR